MATRWPAIVSSTAPQKQAGIRGARVIFAWRIELGSRVDALVRALLEGEERVDLGAIAAIHCMVCVAEIQSWRAACIGI
jgi:hypothetical protein